MKIKYTTHTLYMHTYIYKKRSINQMLLVGCLLSLKMWHPNSVQDIFASTRSEGNAEVCLPEPYVVFQPQH